MKMVEKQTNEPLYGDILWSRPVRRIGRVLLVGGHRDGLAELQKAYQSFDVAGVAESRLAVPDKLAKLLGSFEGISLLASTPSGSIARDALGELTALTSASDAVCIGPDLSNNSETTLTMQRLIAETNAAIIIPPQSIGQLLAESEAWQQRDKTLLFVTTRQLFSLVAHLKLGGEVSLAINAENVADLAARLSAEYAPGIVCLMHDHIIVASNGRASITKVSIGEKDYASLVGLAGTFWMQNLGKAYESLTTAAHVAQKATGLGTFIKGVSEVLAEL